MWCLFIGFWDFTTHETTRENHKPQNFVYQSATVNIWIFMLNQCFSSYIDSRLPRILIHCVSDEQFQWIPRWNILLSYASFRASSWKEKENFSTQFSNWNLRSDAVNNMPTYWQSFQSFYFSFCWSLACETFFLFQQILFIISIKRAQLYFLCYVHVKANLFGEHSEEMLKLLQSFKLKREKLFFLWYRNFKFTSLKFLLFNSFFKYFPKRRYFKLSGASVGNIIWFQSSTRRNPGIENDFIEKLHKVT